MFLVTLALAGLYAAALLAGRLTGLWATWFEPWTVLLVPAAALALAALWPRRPGVQDAAHVIDQQQQTSDLFLTLTLLDSCPGEYQPLVGRDAELRAPKIKPAEVVPLQWERPSVISALVLGVLLAGAYFVPTLDPFGKVAEAREEEDQRKLLEDSRKITEIRRAQLKNKNVEAENSPEVEKALEALKAGFSEMKKGDRRANQEKLKEHQDELGKIFRKLINSPEVKKLNAEGLKADQKLGSLGEEEMFRKMQKELQQGSSESLEQQIDELKDKLERLTKTTDPLEKSELQRQMQKQLKELSDFAGKKAGSKEMQAALERAQQQLDAMKQEGLSKEAMEALQESLEVAQQEMQMLAQEMRHAESGRRTQADQHGQTAQQPGSTGGRDGRWQHDTGRLRRAVPTADGHAIRQRWRRRR